MSTENLNKIVAYMWFSNLPYSKQVEYCQLYFNERIPEDLSTLDVENIYNVEFNKSATSLYTLTQNKGYNHDFERYDTGLKVSILLKEWLQIALNNELWINHKIGDAYTMDGKPELWKIAYYPLFGTYKAGIWIYFDEPRALIEKPIKSGTDFREVPLRYLKKYNNENI